MLWPLKFYVKKTACSKMWKEPNWNTEKYRFHDSPEVKIGADTLGKGENWGRYTRQSGKLGAIHLAKVKIGADTLGKGENWGRYTRQRWKWLFSSL